jgi:acyl carrier protein/NAD(P)-dependent dehydrogenase (short-subunit alcohol dehydrogenase family)
VLVTEGTGELGAALARWLAREGAERLLLTVGTREGLSGAATLSAELRSLGVEVTVTACDATDPGALRKAIAGQRLTAVFHAGGAGPHGAASAAALDEATDGQDLAAFVLFSPGEPVLAAPGDTGEAAWLESLAARRQAEGRAGTAVVWGPWTAASAAGSDDAPAEEPVADPLEESSVPGLRTMPVAPALAALRQALERNDTAVLIADVDWPVFVPGDAAAPAHRLFREVPDIAERAAGAERPAGGSGPAELRGRLREATREEQELMVRRLVFTGVAQALGHASADAVDQDKDFLELGFTSLTTMELTTMLTESTGLELSAAVIFDHPAPVSLAAYLHAELVAALAAPDGAGRTAPAAHHADDVDHVDHKERT